MESNIKENTREKIRRVKKEKPFIEDKKEKRIKRRKKSNDEHKQLKVISTSASNPFYELFNNKENDEDDLEGFDFKHKENKIKFHKKNQKESPIVDNDLTQKKNKFYNNKVLQDDEDKKKKGDLKEKILIDKEEYFDFLIKNNPEKRNNCDLRQEMLEKRINKKIEKYNKISEKALGTDISGAKRNYGLKVISDSENPNLINNNKINNGKEIKDSIYSQDFNINEFNITKNQINKNNKNGDGKEDDLKKEEEEIKSKIIGKGEIAEKDVIFLQKEVNKLRLENSQLKKEKVLSNQLISYFKREIDSLKCYYSDKIKTALEDFQNFIEENNKISYERLQLCENSLKLIDEVKQKYKFIEDEDKNIDFHLNEDLYCGSEKRFIEDFSCIICLNIVVDPTQCGKCDKLFCNNCMKNHLDKYDFCPNCRDAPFSRTNFSRLLKRILDESEFKCPMKCDKIFPYSDLGRHKNECEKFRIANLKCGYCGKNVKGETEEEHKEKCEYFKINCVYCIKQFNKLELKEHYAECESKEKYCNEGKIYYPNKFAEAHETFYKEILIKFKIAVDSLKNIVF